MRLKRQLISVIAFCLIIAVCLILIMKACDNREHTPERHELATVLVDNVWKIVDATDSLSTDISVARRDTVVWQAPDDTDIYFQFMDEELTGIYTQELQQGESLSLIIGENARQGDNPYAVFVLDAREYAQGESPPRMFVRW